MLYTQKHRHETNIIYPERVMETTASVNEDLYIAITLPLEVNALESLIGNRFYAKELKTTKCWQKCCCSL